MTLTNTSSELYCGKDLKLNNNGEDVMIDYKDDFIIVSYYDNLKQAIINRLKTNQGELSQHPEYGSNLKTLIGQKNSSLILSEARQMVREALLQEPRINEIKNISVKYTDTTKQTILIDIKFTPIGSTNSVLNLIYPYFIG